MAGKRKPPPIEVVEENIEDAHRLIEFADALTNGRRRKMRREKREALGQALNYPKRRWDELDCVESAHVFLLLKPDGGLSRERFTDDALRPLLRQAVVAIAAAVESYVARRACEGVARAMNGAAPKRLRELSISLGDVIDVEQRLQRRKFGYRALVEEHLKREASASPSKIGEVFSTIGVEKLWPAVNTARGKARGTSERQLDALASRRNQIAHAGDWSGRGRASLSVEEVEGFYRDAKEIIEAVERLLAA